MAPSKSSGPKEGSSTPKVKRKPIRKAKNAKELVDDQLARYRSMRDFAITDEPSGDAEANGRGTLPFCVQKHEASHLHYDFRLAWNGVLKSWAVAKGPSYFTGDKRLAVQVEDHPLEYGGFEGVIPKGQYGGGTVMLWDQGSWEPQAEYSDVEAGLRDGSLKFVLHGERLKGKWALIRMKSKAKGTKSNWLLIKEHDSYERSEDVTPVTEAQLTSVVTKRTMKEIASNEDHVWQSAKGAATKPKASMRQAKGKVDVLPALKEQFEALAYEEPPLFIPPQLAVIAEVPPSSEGWLHELKLDGYRIQARKSGDRVAMLTRTGLDWTHRMPAISNEIAALPAEDVTLDGELVVLSENGTTSFADLQAAMQEGAAGDLSYFAFDLLHLNGRRVRDLKLVERKELLADLLKRSEVNRILFSEHLERGGEKLLLEACKLHAEGIVSKKSASVYLSGRSNDWIKTKCLHEQEFVVGGFTLPTNHIHGIGALLLGYYRDGALIYAGRTGTGFTQKTHRLLRDALDRLRQSKCPFEAIGVEARKGAHWVSPGLVVQVRFATWTGDGLVRQAAFLGIREDKQAKDVVREEESSSYGARKGRSGMKSSSLPAAKKAPQPKTPDRARTTVRLTHPEKVLDASSGLTKQMLSDYYRAIAPYLLAEIIDRPVSLVRCPDGIGNGSFFQKHRNAMLPAEVKQVDVPDKKTGKIEPYITIDSVEGLTSLAQISVLEIHPWGSRNEHLEHPDRLIFDLDPDEALTWQDLREAAELVHDRLDRVDLKSFVKTTGGKGLHVVCPIAPDKSWEPVKTFAHTFVSAIEKEFPQRYLTKMNKAARKGKIYLDYLRNERGATSVAAYSPRGREGAPVSLPLSWKELKTANRMPVFNVAEYESWKTRLKKNPWKAIDTIKQRLPDT
ncbi:MAG: DNA ligase D [Edaphobacter sp.]|uniref:DNA ligase D n=1 Tax=Edaphobacter sp. TaxID=1934404 RepID=UPI00239D6303|nr:DNA ligase D [Edaphobacter sp.]MDE1175211.1 DNA ligase D [Edaphobacter sp.]